MLASLTSAFQNLFAGSSTDFVPILDVSDGGQDEFEATYDSHSNNPSEAVVLGEGEFGTVTLIQPRPRAEMTNPTDVKESKEVLHPTIQSDLSNKDAPDENQERKKPLNEESETTLPLDAGNRGSPNNDINQNKDNQTTVQDGSCSVTAAADPTSRTEKPADRKESKEVPDPTTESDVRDQEQKKSADGKGSEVALPPGPSDKDTLNDDDDQKKDNQATAKGDSGNTTIDPLSATTATATPKPQQQQASSSLLACKTLRKGVVLKDNVLYAPLSPQVLQTEIDCLRVLQGTHSCLRLHAVYETPKTILLVTDLCTDGDVLDYRAKYLQQQHEQQRLQMHIVASIANQLLDAVQHCFANGIIHRDIKAQNCLISSSLNNDSSNTTTPPIRLTLIDFGSSVLHKDYHKNNNNDSEKLLTLKDLPTHTTYAGSAFYVSPEMFQRTYTQKTDVWSAGMVLFVVVFGYPPEMQGRRQRVFDALISSKPRDWQHLMEESSVLSLDEDKKKKLQLPPQSLLDLLSDCLTYRHKRRPNAQDLLESHPEFWQLLRNGGGATCCKDDSSNNNPPTSSQTSPTNAALGDEVIVGGSNTESSDAASRTEAS